MTVVFQTLVGTPSSNLNYSGSVRVAWGWVLGETRGRHTCIFICCSQARSKRGEGASILKNLTCTSGINVQFNWPTHFEKRCYVSGIRNVTDPTNISNQFFIFIFRYLQLFTNSDTPSGWSIRCHVMIGTSTSRYEPKI